MTDNDLIINGNTNIASAWGVTMGENFLNVLSEALTPKDYVENESRNVHGKRVIVEDDVFFSSRELLLEFHIHGCNQEDFLRKKRHFLSEIYKGVITLEVPTLGNEIYHLIYKGKSGEYGMNVARTFCKITLRFEEPNPMERT